MTQSMHTNVTARSSVLLRTADLNRWSARRALVILALGLQLAAPAVALGDDDGWATNYDRVRETASAAVDSLLANFDEHHGEELRVVIEPPHETDWLVDEFMGKALRARGYRVVTDSTATAVELAVTVVELGLRYTDSHRRFWFGAKRVERLSVASLRGKVMNAGSVSWSGEGVARRIDEVPADKLPLLEGHSYPFTAPSLPPRNIGRVLEPVLVGVIVLGLVVLFTSNRS